ncbi:cation:proton antiporter [Uliginosibacterium paludis]|uniref:Cation:proton antiporter n=1 Tax=Uliginosibacterium paludis TaxID=1615952 RepID=A0ABV2CR98_9RHOO
MTQAWAMVAISLIVLVAYLFDFLGRFIRVPAVVLLLFSGLALRLVSDTLGWQPALPADLLPVLGTFGLILIVLEGALDLRLTRQATPLILRSSACAVLGILLVAAALTGLFSLWFAAPLQAVMAHAMPLAVISSAVAIPAAAALVPRLREFVVYESSISDIVGVVLFYAVIGEVGPLGSMLLRLAGEVGLSILVGLVAGLLIYWLIQRIEHHVRVLPMIFGITLLYGLGKILHLAPLIMVLLVGLLLNNSQLLGSRLKSSPSYERDLDAFKHLTAEFTFAVRSFFFVLLGFATAPADLLAPSAWLLAVLIVALCVILRWPVLRLVAGEKAEPLIWFAPRGLITVLLFLSIPPALGIAGFPGAALMLVILMWALLLTRGVMRIRPESGEGLTEPVPAHPTQFPEQT